MVGDGELLFDDALGVSSSSVLIATRRDSAGQAGSLAGSTSAESSLH